MINKQRPADWLVYIGDEEIARAASVYLYMTSMAQSTQHFIFRQVVKDMLACSQCYTEEEAIEQLAVSLVKSTSYKADDRKLRLLYECFASKKSSALECQFMNAIKEKDDAFLKVAISSIPEEKDIYKTFSAFYPETSGADTKPEAKYKELVKKITLKSQKLMENGLNTRKWEDTSWCFTPFGYLTVFENWLNSEEETNPFDYYFYNLYFKGKVMDLVIETIFQCEVPSMSLRLNNQLKEHAAVNKAFADCVNSRFNRYREIHPEIPTRQYEYDPDAGVNEKMTVKALDMFSAIYNVNEKDLEKLYEQMNGNVLQCSLNVFISLFSGTFTGTIRWLSTSDKLCGFLRAFSDYSNDMKFSTACERAVEIFRVKSKGQWVKPNVTTLLQYNQYKEKHYDYFANLFKKYAFHKGV